VTRPRGRPQTPTSALVPAAARGDTLSPLEAVLNTEAIEVFAKAVGGRQQLADTLALAGTGSSVEQITTLLLDPRYAQWSLARLCQTVGITVAELFAAYRTAMIARAQIESTHIIAKKLPPIVTDVMDKALSDPTVERHKLALELGQLLDKKGGFLVQQNVVAAQLSAAAPGALEQLQQAVGDLLFGGAPVPTPPSEPGDPMPPPVPRGDAPVDEDAEADPDLPDEDEPGDPEDDDGDDEPPRHAPA
jgi:hypothetical protein